MKREHLTNRAPKNDTAPLITDAHTPYWTADTCFEIPPTQIFRMWNDHRIDCCVKTERKTVGRLSVRSNSVVSSVEILFAWVYFYVLVTDRNDLPRIFLLELWLKEYLRRQRWLEKRKIESRNHDILENFSSFETASFYIRSKRTAAVTFGLIQIGFFMQPACLIVFQQFADKWISIRIRWFRALPRTLRRPDPDERFSRWIWSAITLSVSRAHRQRQR